MIKITPNRRELNEQGIVSITVTMVFILVISLTVLGFSQVVQRNSRQALDRQLGSQAFYAAETGVNDVMNKIAELVELGQEIPEQTECKDDTKYTKNDGKVYDDDETILYTCLLVDPTPETLQYDNVGAGSVIVPLNATAPDILNEHTIKWQKAEDAPATAAANKCQGPTNNRLAADWVANCPYGLIRLDIMPANDQTIGSPREAARQTMTVFLYPTAGGSVPEIQYANSTPNAYGVGAPQGLVSAASCSDVTNTCEAKLTNLLFSSAYMRVQSLYVPTPSFQVHIDSGSFSRSQVVIDVTGKSQDVLRRVRVQLSMTGSSSRTDINGFSDFAIQSTDSLCKRYATSPVVGQEVARNDDNSLDSDLQCPN